MIHPRLFALALVAAFSLSMGAVSTASAFPEFNPATKQSYRSPHSIWSDSSGSTTCTTNTGAGEITGATTVGKVVLTYKGCTAVVGGKMCTVKSPGAGEGEIITKTLKGQLGEVAPSEANSKVGLLLEAETGSAISVTSGSCLSESTLDGSVIGEVPPPGRSSKFSYIDFEKSGSHQRIQKLTLKSGSEFAELESFGEEVFAEGAGGIEFTEHAVEVT